MYHRIWDKYLPIIKLLIKKEDAQTLGLNQLDFESIGISKSKAPFKIKFENGRVANIIHDRPLAVELAHQLLDDEQAFDTISQKDMMLTLNTKYQLKIEPMEEAE